MAAPGVPVLLAALAAGLGPIALVAHMAYADSSQFMSAEVIEARIREYESFGWHRTGGAGDGLTSEWLRAELEDAGVRARLEPVAFPRVTVERADISWPGGQVEGEPLYDGDFTDAGGVHAALAGGGFGRRRAEDRRRRRTTTRTISRSTGPSCTLWSRGCMRGAREAS